METSAAVDLPMWDGDTSAALTQKEWDYHRSTIEHLYFVNKHPLKKVRNMMADTYQFHATERMYKARFRLWKKRKNTTAKEMVKIIKIIKDRAELGKETTVRVRGNEIDATKLRKFRNRKRQTEKDLLATASSRSTTPSDMSIFTPRDSPAPEPVSNNCEDIQLADIPSIQQIFDLDSILYFNPNQAQINLQDFVEVSFVKLTDQQTQFSEEMSSITNEYFASYFDTPGWIFNHSLQSVDYAGDEIQNFANLDYSGTIDANKDVFDFANPGTLVTLYEVACLLFQRENTQAANRLIEQAKALIGSLLENEHPQLLGCLFLAICILEAKERMDLVSGLLDFAHWKSTSIHGPTHPISRMISCCSRASACHQSNASFSLEGIVANFKGHIGQDHTFTLRLIQLHAWSLFQQGRFEAALNELQKLQQVYNEHAGEDHIHTRHTLFEIAQIYTAQGKLDAAEEVFQRVYQLSEQRFGRDHPLMINFECLRMLAVIHRRQKRHEKELSTLCQAFPMGIKVLGREHPTVLLLGDDLKKMLG